MRREENEQRKNMKTGEKQRADNRPCFTETDGLYFTLGSDVLSSTWTCPCDPFSNNTRTREQQRQRV